MEQKGKVPRRSSNVIRSSPSEASPPRTLVESDEEIASLTPHPDAEEYAITPDTEMIDLTSSQPEIPTLIDEDAIDKVAPEVPTSTMDDQ